ncbi:AMP-binding protein [Paraneptunicella aestuarii]|nr:AMP-binding protein [Paraneptunicella aestuarii]UAA37193.1 AMP-binding protein [Paraneptunicella aestuarii]
MNSLLQGAWSYVLQGYSGSERVMFGTVVSGRPGALWGVERMLGLFINTIPVVVDVDKGLSLGQWLVDIHGRNVASDEHQYLSLSDIQGLTAIPVGTALFDSLLVYENQPGHPGGASASDGGIVVGRAGSDERTEYALLVRAKLEHGRLECEFHYHGDVLSDSMSRQMLSHFERVLEQMARGGEDLQVGELSLLSEAEREQMLVGWNQTEVAHPEGLCLHELFERQVQQNPDRVALYFDGESMSYGELNARSNRLARYLRAQGVCKETLVGVCTERNFDVVVSVLAVLKAGGAYVPLEPDYPLQRLGYMVGDAGLDYLLTQEAIAPRFEGLGSGHVLSVDSVSLEEVLREESSQDLGIEVGSDSLCYVIYTSGSTGQPKGVMAQHDGVLNRFTGCGVNILFVMERCFVARRHWVLWIRYGSCWEVCYRVVRRYCYRESRSWSPPCFWIHW